MGLESKIRTALKWSVIGKVATQLIGWVLTFWTIRILTPDDYGLFALAMLSITLFNLINEFGLSPAIIADQDLTDEKIKSAYGLILTINTVICIIIFLLSPYISILLEDERLTLVIQVISVQFILGSLSVVPSALLIRQLNFKQKEFVFFAKNIMSGGLTLILALLGYGVWALAWGNLASLLTAAILFNLNTRYLPSFDFSKARSMLNFASKILTQRIVWWIYSEADIFLLKRVFSTSVVGSYYTAKSLASMPGDKTGGIVTEIVLTGFSKIRDDKELVCKSLTRGIKMMLLVMFPVYFGISSISQEFVYVVLGEKWIDSIVPLQILCIAFAFRTIQIPINEALNALNEVTLAAQNSIIIAVIVVSSIAIGTSWGLLGVSVAWLGGFFVSLLITIHRGGKFTGIGVRELIKILIRPLLCSCIMYGVIYGLRLYALEDLSQIIKLVLLVLAGAIAFIGSALILERETLYELKSLMLSKNI